FHGFPYLGRQSARVNLDFGLLAGDFRFLSSLDGFSPFPAFNRLGIIDRLSPFNGFGGFDPAFTSAHDDRRGGKHQESREQKMLNQPIENEFHSSPMRVRVRSSLQLAAAE